MRIAFAYVLASQGGTKLPWGLDGFESYEDATGFLGFIQEELALGARTT